ncbi:MAG: S41 family peptidase [Gammaproteobacteria bacterium]
MKTLYRTIVICLLLGGVPVCYAEDETGAQDAEERSAIPLDEIRTFAEVFARVKKDYVESVNDTQLLESAIRGMLEGLDPHSAYLDQDAYTELQEGTAGEFGGLGIQVGMEDGFVKVISPIDDTPAKEAGVEAGDLIIRLDDTPVKGMSLNDAVSRMRGEPGTDITLTIIRDGEEKPLKLTITRDIIKVQSVKHRTLEPGLGYLRISNFQAHTAEDTRLGLEKLIAENDDKLDGLILDLRNNPGGILNAAVAVSDLFLDEGLIVYTDGRIKDSKLKFHSTPADMLDNAPIVLLVNAGSASASEIVAGALQDHRRAIIMGRKTFGKGSVQTILPISNEAALKLTTALYFTPSGRSIQASGIEPDIVIDQVKLEKVEAPSVIKEQNLDRHLGEKQMGEDDEQDDADEMPEESLVTSDYVLYEALNVLKGLKILGKAE